nr:ribonuclease H-like domain-containing protein [Tanacetum cinerariifolium]
MDLETAQTNDAAKLPLLKPENGNSFKPVARTTANADGTSTSIIPCLVTTKEKAQKKNDVKARTMLLMRNKPDLDTMSFDDLYNNFKIVEQEVKRTVTTSSSTGSQNIVFVSSPGSTNEVDTANIQVSVISIPVSTASTYDNTANLSDATVYAFLANQPNGSHLVYEDLEQIHEDDLEEMNLKWQLELLSMRARKYFQRTGKKITINDTVGYDKSKVECFNYYKMGHFSFMIDEEVPTNMALMNFSYSEISDNSRKFVGFVIYNVVAPPSTCLFAPPTINLSNFSLEEFQQPEFEGYGSKVNKNVCENSSNKIKKTSDALTIDEWVFDSDEDKSKVMNMVLVTKTHNKTPYELLIGRAHIISFMRPYGCLVTILNTLDHLDDACKKSIEQPACDKGFDTASSSFGHPDSLKDHSKMTNFEDTGIFDDAYDDRDEGA